MAITSNVEQLQVIRADAYSLLVNRTLKDYESNMIDRFDNEFPSEDYIQECRDFEVNYVENSDYEALEAIDTDDNYEFSQVFMNIIEVVLEQWEEKPKNITLGGFYTIWRYIITQDVEFYKC